jgi:hypothetical protein
MHAAMRARHHTLGRGLWVRLRGLIRARRGTMRLQASQAAAPTAIHIRILPMRSEE